jgi:hypothetical protein
MRVLPHNLTPASGCQDHTTSPSASACVRLSQAPRPPHPTARFVTCATPLSSGETGRASSADLPDGLSGIFFARGLDRFLVICPSGQLVTSENGSSPLRANESRECAPDDRLRDSSAEAQRAKAEAIHSAARLGGRGLLLGRNRTQPWGTLIGRFRCYGLRGEAMAPSSRQQSDGAPHGKAERPEQMPCHP